MYGAHWHSVVCELFGSAALAFLRESENQFVHGRMKTLSASPQAIELNPSFSVQAHSKGPGTGPRNENAEYGYGFGVLRALFIIRPLSQRDV